MTKINLHEAKAKLSKYARMVKAGETILLCDRNRPFAEIKPLPGVGTKKKRRLGLMKGTCHLEKSFFEADREISKSFFEGKIVSARKQ